MFAHKISVLTCNDSLWEEREHGVICTVLPTMVSKSIEYTTFKNRFKTSKNVCTTSSISLCCGMMVSVKYCDCKCYYWCDCLGDLITFLSKKSTVWCGWGKYAKFFLPLLHSAPLDNTMIGNPAGMLCINCSFVVYHDDGS